MIHKLRLKNFKKVHEETFLFSNFNIIVGANNSGKSTALQALAIWQYCVDQFKLAPKTGTRGIQIVLPNFTALPVPEFNLLWRDKIDRIYTKKENSDKKEQIYIYIEIDVYWKDSNGQEKNFCVTMRYQSPQAVFAIPANGWAEFGELIQTPEFPKIVYVPPFSGIEPHEQWMDDGNVKQHIGKSQPGSVLRNLLFRVINTNTPIEENQGWIEICNKINEWFGIELQVPQYTFGVSTEIKTEYKSNGKSFDVISGGSGFHQIITLFAFLYGYPDVTTILLDEPDAHLHNNLQKKIVNYLIDKNKQFLIATHSEEFIRNVDIHSIISIMSGRPIAIDSTEKIINALSEVDNNDILRTQDSAYILYVEGEDDDRILAAWANIIGETDVYQKFYTYSLGGRSKKLMKERSDCHYTALKQIVPTLKRMVLLDYDTEDSYHPDPTNPCLKEWKRKNIDNYLLVPNAWKRAVAFQLNESEDSLFLSPYYSIINDFFESQNLYLPRNATWRTVNANIFSIIDGKKLLFSNPDSLFNRILVASDGQLKISRQNVALAMRPEEAHQDIYDFFQTLKQVSAEAQENLSQESNC